MKSSEFSHLTARRPDVQLLNLFACHPQPERANGFTWDDFVAFFHLAASVTRFSESEFSLSFILSIG